VAGEDILVFQLASRGDSKCDECGRELFKGNLLIPGGDRSSGWSSCKIRIDNPMMRMLSKMK
jgi:hypothetical protein